MAEYSIKKKYHLTSNCITIVINYNFTIYRFYPVLLMGKTNPFTQFYPNGFTQWAKLNMPTLMRAPLDITWQVAGVIMTKS